MVLVCRKLASIYMKNHVMIELQILKDRFASLYIHYPNLQALNCQKSLSYYIFSFSYIRLFLLHKFKNTHEIWHLSLAINSLKQAELIKVGAARLSSAKI